MAVQREQTNGAELVEKVIQVNRVAKVVQGGRRFSFSALVVVGNGNGRVACALGKANEVAEAIRKGIDRATRGMRPVVCAGRTIPHPMRYAYGATRVVLQPCAPGRGIIAAGPLRAVMEAAGIHDISVKTLGSRNPHNMLKAALGALYEMISMREVAERRGLPLAQLREAARMRMPLPSAPLSSAPGVAPVPVSSTA